MSCFAALWMVSAMRHSVYLHPVLYRFQTILNGFGVLSCGPFMDAIFLLSSHYLSYHFGIAHSGALPKDASANLLQPHGEWVRYRPSYLRTSECAMSPRFNLDPHGLGYKA